MKFFSFLENSLNNSFSCISLLNCLKFCSFLKTVSKFPSIYGQMCANLAAPTSEFDSQKGVLIHPELNSVWQSNKNVRKLVNLDNAHEPTRSIVSSLKQSNHNRFVEFTKYDMDAVVEQSTLPIIDIWYRKWYPICPYWGSRH